MTECSGVQNCLLSYSASVLKLHSFDILLRFFSCATTSPKHTLCKVHFIPIHVFHKFLTTNILTGIPLPSYSERSSSGTDMGTTKYAGNLKTLIKSQQQFALTMWNTTGTVQFFKSSQNRNQRQTIFGGHHVAYPTIEFVSRDKLSNGSPHSSRGYTPCMYVIL